MKKLNTVAAVSGLAILLSSFGHTVYADSYIDAPRPVSTLANFESAGRTSLVAAGADISIHDLKNLPDGRRVRLNGVIESVKNKHDFVLRDETGRIDVSLSSAQKMKIAKGADVSVSGRISRGILGSNIDANMVTVRAKATEAAIEGKPVKATDNKHVQNYSIQNLPENGVVRVSGIVTTAGNEQGFVLKDATGLVDITVVAGDASKVMKGSHVTVIGSVDRGVLGKDISSHAIVVNDNRIVASAE